MESVKGNMKTVSKGVDYAGVVVNSWTILGEAVCEKSKNTEKYYTKWLCRCSCGQEKYVNKEQLLANKTKGCRACATKKNMGDNNPMWSGFGDIPMSVFYRMKLGAEKRNIPVEVTIEDLDQQWKKQRGLCFLTGTRISLGDDASVDRLNSLGSYSKDNIVFVNKIVNVMKNKFSMDVFLYLCSRVVDTHGTKAEIPEEFACGNTEKLRDKVVERLTKSQVLEIRELSKTLSYGSIAKIYNTHSRHISRIVRGERWKFIDIT